MLSTSKNLKTFSIVIKAMFIALLLVVLIPNSSMANRKYGPSYLQSEFQDHTSVAGRTFTHESINPQGTYTQTMFGSGFQTDLGILDNMAAHPPFDPGTLPVTDLSDNGRTQSADINARAGAGQSLGYSGNALQVGLSAVAQTAAARANNPLTQMTGAQSQAMGAATGGANVAAEIGHNQAESAIQYTGSFLYNFTVDGGNRWNRIRDTIFVPMGILFLLPGAVISQTRAIIAAGNPVLGQVNPFDGILRSLVAIFLIPGTYLVMNYGIDVANSITHTISTEYFRLFGSDMYRDALCHEIKAMPYRLPEENRNAIDIPVSSMGIPLMGNVTPFAMLEASLIAVKILDPCVGVYIVPEDRADEVVPAAVTATRMFANTSNAGLVTSWNILCAFQMAYLYYLWCVGPVVAGLWVWPIKSLQGALPSWVEGVITLCFWSLFWNTVILLMAAFRGVDETGTIIMLALNTLANLSVKFAFDFAGLARAAGSEAMRLGEKMAKAAESGGGGKKGGGGDKGGGGQDKNKGGPNQPGQPPPGEGENRNPGTTPGSKTETINTNTTTESSGDPGTESNARAGASPMLADNANEGTRQLDTSTSTAADTRPQMTQADHPEPPRTGSVDGNATNADAIAQGPPTSGDLDAGKAYTDARVNEAMNLASSPGADQIRDINSSASASSGDINTGDPNARTSVASLTGDASSVPNMLTADDGSVTDLPNKTSKGLTPALGAATTGALMANRSDKDANADAVDAGIMESVDGGTGIDPTQIAANARTGQQTGPGARTGARTGRGTPDQGAIRNAENQQLAAQAHGRDSTDLSEGTIDKPPLLSEDSSAMMARSSTLPEGEDGAITNLSADGLNDPGIPSQMLARSESPTGVDNVTSLQDNQVGPGGSDIPTHARQGLEGTQVAGLDQTVNATDGTADVSMVSADTSSTTHARSSVDADNVSMAGLDQNAVASSNVTGDAINQGPTTEANFNQSDVVARSDYSDTLGTSSIQDSGTGVINTGEGQMLASNAADTGSSNLLREGHSHVPIEPGATGGDASVAQSYTMGTDYANTDIASAGNMSDPGISPVQGQNLGRDVASSDPTMITSATGEPRPQGQNIDPSSYASNEARIAESRASYSDGPVEQSSGTYGTSEPQSYARDAGQPQGDPGSIEPTMIASSGPESSISDSVSTHTGASVEPSPGAYGSTEPQTYARDAGQPQGGPASIEPTMIAGAAQEARQTDAGQGYVDQSSYAGQEPRVADASATYTGGPVEQSSGTAEPQSYARDVGQPQGGPGSIEPTMIAGASQEPRVADASATYTGGPVEQSSGTYGSTDPQSYARDVGQPQSGPGSIEPTMIAGASQEPRPADAGQGYVDQAGYTDREARIADAGATQTGGLVEQSSSNYGSVEPQTYARDVGQSGPGSVESTIIPGASQEARPTDPGQGYVDQGGYAGQDTRVADSGAAYSDRPVEQSSGTFGASESQSYARDAGQPQDGPGSVEPTMIASASQEPRPTDSGQGYVDQGGYAGQDTRVAHSGAAYSDRPVEQSSGTYGTSDPQSYARDAGVQEHHGGHVPSSAGGEVHPGEGMSHVSHGGESAHPPESGGHEMMSRDAADYNNEHHHHHGSSDFESGSADRAREDAIRHEEHMRAEMEARRNQMGNQNQRQVQNRGPGFIPVPYGNRFKGQAPQTQSIFKSKNVSGKKVKDPNLGSKLKKKLTSETTQGQVTEEATDEPTKVDNIKPQESRIQPKRKKKDTRNRLRSALGEADSPPPEMVENPEEKGDKTD